jgi:hypothetical protein
MGINHQGCFIFGNGWLLATGGFYAVFARKQNYAERLCYNWTVSSKQHQDALEYLSRHMSPEQIVLFAQLIEQIRVGSRFGAVRVIIADKRITTMKKEESFSCKTEKYPV